MIISLTNGCWILRRDALLSVDPTCATADAQISQEKLRKEIKLVCKESISFVHQQKLREWTRRKETKSKSKWKRNNNPEFGTVRTDDWWSKLWKERKGAQGLTVRPCDQCCSSPLVLNHSLLKACHRRSNRWSRSTGSQGLGIAVHCWRSVSSTTLHWSPFVQQRFRDEWLVGRLTVYSRIKDWIWPRLHRLLPTFPKLGF